MYAFAWAMMPLITGVNYKKEPFGTSCTVNWAGERIKDKIFITSLVVFIVIFNVIVMIYCYINILMVTKTEMQRRPNRQENQVTQLCLLLVLVFLLCWMPYAIISLWATFGKAASVPTWLTVAPVMFAKLSSCINPVIYIVVSSKFRHRYLALLKCPSKNRIKHSEVNVIAKEDRAEHSMMTEVPDMTDVSGKPTSQQLPDHTSRAVAVPKSPSLPCQI
ncbi:visual pigment-like receptor peropsin [Haliotis cracherodii]|uniref:visual pigment-like receptor peropsin n=1 Tax=Haliotis cracherodii TaxID=6455 RepID=UPI0039EB18D8